jgi:hypothetical protein
MIYEGLAKIRTLLRPTEDLASSAKDDQAGD